MGIDHIGQHHDHGGRAMKPHFLVGGGVELLTFVSHDHSDETHPGLPVEWAVARQYSPPLRGSTGALFAICLAYIYI